MQADNDHPPLLDVIARRTSSRAFATTPVVEEMIETLLEAARWAPSYGNRQSWRFVVVRDPAIRDHAAVLTDRERLRQAAQLEP
ncbi:MAG: nitroreductase family protein, partial [Vicinamibacterales bacterium]